MPRKAASSPKAVELDRSRMPVALGIALVFGVAITWGAIVWGRSDSGQIDVSATIANSQYVSDSAADASQPPIGIPSQEYVDMPNGGLVASPASENPAPQPPAVEVNATSTGTTTDEGIEVESSDEEGADGSVSEDSVTPEETIPETE